MPSLPSRIRLPNLGQLSLGWRLLIVLAAVVVIWLPIAVITVLPVAAVDGFDGNGTAIAAGVSLYAILLLVIWGWGRLVRQYPEPLRAYGWHWARKNWLGTTGRNLGLGVAIAIVSMGIFYAIEALLGWVAIVFPTEPTPWHWFWLNGLLLGAGVAFLEELVFRGWLWTELRWSLGFKPTLWISSVIFAVLHFLKPLDVILASWPQFPGLILLGWVLGQGRHLGHHSKGTLTVPIAMHGAWVCAITVSQSAGLVIATGSVPQWLTGVGGNPLAGVFGFGLLAGVGGIVVALSSRTNYRQKNT
ncbi:MAG: type II CAAX endopeptidase family protein [Cyanobacteria bacterium P01_C01_bin.89]